MRSVRIWTMWTLLPDWSQNYARFSYQNFWFSSEIVLSLSRLTFAHRAVQFIIYLLWLENVYLGCSTVLFFGEKRVGNVWQQLMWVQFGIIWNDNFWYCIDRGKIIDWLSSQLKEIAIFQKSNSFHLFISGFRKALRSWPWHLSATTECLFHLKQHQVIRIW